MVKRYKVGDKVVWTLRDGNTMAGTISFACYDARYYVKRVDGSEVGPIDDNKLSYSTPDDVTKACEFFANIGK